MKTPPERRASVDRYQKRHPERVKVSARKSRLKAMYGITLDEYNRMLDAQGGGCAICGCTETENGAILAVDHDHATGKVRGILCRLCNNGLGHFRDTERLFLKAIAYLKEHREP
jgi:hypothetical protein